MAYIKIDSENRITAASCDFHCGDGEIEVEIPEEIRIPDIHNYLFIDGEFVYDPLPKPEETEEVSVWDELDAAYQEGVNSL